MKNVIDQAENPVQKESSPEKEKAKKVLRIIRFILDLLQSLFKKIIPSV